MNFTTIYQVITKLVGPIEPIGETNTDEKRFENLKMMTDIVNELVTEIEHVSYSERQQFSVKRAGKFADDFLKELKDGLPSREEN